MYNYLSLEEFKDIVIRYPYKVDVHQLEHLIIHRHDAVFGCGGGRSTLRSYMMNKKMPILDHYNDPVVGAMLTKFEYNAPKKKKTENTEKKNSNEKEKIDLLKTRATNIRKVKLKLNYWDSGHLSTKNGLKGFNTKPTQRYATNIIFNRPNIKQESKDQESKDQSKAGKKV
eukprot:UN30625